MLHLAAKKNYRNIVKMLIKSKFPIDSITIKGETAIALAAKQGHLGIIKDLIKAGADVNKTDNDGIGPLYLSILHNRETCSEYFIE